MVKIQKIGATITMRLPNTSRVQTNCIIKVLIADLSTSDLCEIGSTAALKSNYRNELQIEK